jgi:hypothetical protein
MEEQKHMSHLRNIVEGIEDKGYIVLSVKYNENNRVSVEVENPGLAGNLAFLQKAAEQEGRQEGRVVNS